MIIDEKVIVELKVVRTLKTAHEAQLITLFMKIFVQDQSCLCRLHGRHVRTRTGRQADRACEKNNGSTERSTELTPKACRRKRKCEIKFSFSCFRDKNISCLVPACPG